MITAPAAYSGYLAYLLRCPVSPAKPVSDCSRGQTPAPRDQRQNFGSSTAARNAAPALCGGPIARRTQANERNHVGGGHTQDGWIIFQRQLGLNQGVLRGRCGSSSRGGSGPIVRSPHREAAPSRRVAARGAFPRNTPRGSRRLCSDLSDSRRPAQTIPPPRDGQPMPY